MTTGKRSIPWWFHPVAKHIAKDGTEYLLGFHKSHGTGIDTKKASDGQVYRVIVPRMRLRLTWKKWEVRLAKKTQSKLCPQV